MGIFNGNSISKSVKESRFTGLEEGYSYIATKDVGYGFDTLKYENDIKIPFDEPKFKIAKKGAVLICSEGGSAGKKSGLTTQDISFGNKLYAIELYDKIEPIFILSLYQTPIFYSQFESLMTGIIGGISIINFSAIAAPLPPLPEQQVIVEIVESLFKEIEALEEAAQQGVQLKEQYAVSALRQLTTGETVKAWSALKPQFKRMFDTPTNIQQLRETILQLAVQGKLTTKWRKANPDLISGENSAEALLKRIQAEKAQLIKEKKIKKEKPLPEITAEEIPYELPEGWVWCRLGEVLISFLGGFAYKSQKFIETSKNQVIRLGNVKNNYLRLDSKPVYIDDDYAAESEGYELIPDDILITMTGTRAKKDYCFTLKIDENDLKERRLFLNQRVGCLRFSKSLIIEHTNLTLKDNTLLEPIFDSATGTANQANIGKNALLNFLYPLPPKAEQQAIVTQVNQLMQYCDALEAACTQQSTTSQQLMQSVLREVLEGRN